MSKLIRHMRRSRRQFHLLILAVAAFVIGWPLVTITPEAQANNPVITTGVNLAFEGVNLNETGNVSEVITNDDDTEFELTPSFYGGTGTNGTWEYSTDGGVTFTTVTLTGGVLTIPFPTTERSQTIIVRYTLPDGSCWHIELKVRRANPLSPP